MRFTTGFVAALLCICSQAIPAQVLLVTGQELNKRWTAIEKVLFSGSPEPVSLLAALEDFQGATESFLSTELYRLYRYTPFRDDRPLVTLFKRHGPGEITSIQELPGLTAALMDALERGDRDAARTLTGSISDSMLRWMELDKEADNYVAGAYLGLFMVFSAFIMIAIMAIWFFSRALNRSFRREQESMGFSQALVLVQEDERRRLSRELHDTVIQDIRYLILRMGKIERTANRNERAEYCREASVLQEGLIVKLRDICEALIPPDFSIQGLSGALGILCHNFGKRTGIDCRIDMAEDLCMSGLDSERQLQVYRIVQEALTNIEKHAQAREAVVVLQNTAGGIMVSVSDDGKGFIPPGNNKHGHLGIRGMYERAAMLRGKLSIESEKGEGTLVSLETPLYQIGG